MLQKCKKKWYENKKIKPTQIPPKNCENKKVFIFQKKQTLPTPKMQKKKKKKNKKKKNAHKKNIKSKYSV